jgi:hypothetical protein
LLCHSFFIVLSMDFDSIPAPTLSRGMWRSSEPCFRNTVPEGGKQQFM